MHRTARSLLMLAVIGCLFLMSACVAAKAFRGERGERRGRAAERQQQMQTQVPSQGLQSTAAAGQLQQESIDAGGMRRNYLVYVPDSLPAGTQAPLVLAFHGGGGGPQGFAERTGLMGMADRYGFLLILPEGVRNSWNTGADTGYASRSGVDDVGFVSALLDTAAVNYPVDSSRVYATGMSAGGMLTYRLACDLPGRFSAIAVVAGTLATPTCSGADEVSLLHIHGTNDENVPLEGGAGEMSARTASYPSVYSAIDLFKSRNQCGGGSMSSPAQDTSCETSACADGETVQFCQVQGGGHAWPGIAAARWQERNDVYVSPYFNATDYIAQFLLSH